MDVNKRVLQKERLINMLPQAPNEMTHFCQLQPHAAQCTRFSSVQNGRRPAASEVAHHVAKYPKFLRPSHSWITNWTGRWKARRLQCVCCRERFKLPTLDVDLEQVDERLS